MRRAYFMPADKLEGCFSAWEQKWNDTRKDINNPKVPLHFVIENGELLYTDQKHLDLAKAAIIRSERTKAAADRRKVKAEARADLLHEAGNAAKDNPVSLVRRKRRS